VSAHRTDVRQHSLFLKVDGRVLATGSNYHGQLGDGSTTDRHSRVVVQRISDGGTMLFNFLTSDRLAVVPFDTCA
jgi:alpha-tubulin suppressor-like RCC1 family protein